MEKLWLSNLDSTKTFVESHKKINTTYFLQFSDLGKTYLKIMIDLGYRDVFTVVLVNVLQCK